MESSNRFSINFHIYLFLIFVILCESNLSQSIGDYRSISSDSWNGIYTWEHYTLGGWEETNVPPSSSNGVITIRSGHTVSVTTTVTADQIIVESGGTLRINTGTLNVADGTGADLVVNGNFDGYNGTLSVTGKAEINGTIDLKKDARIGGSGQLQIYSGGTMDWSGGSLDITSTQIDAGANLIISGSDNKVFRLTNGAIYNYGTISWTGTGQIRGEGNDIQNKSTGIFNIEEDAGMFYDGGGGSPFSLINEGTIRKTAGSGIFDFDFTVLTNSGSVECQSGTLSFGYGGIHTGSFNASSGAVVKFDGNSTHTMDDGVTFNGSGSIELAGGAMNCSGSITGTEVASEATFDYSGGVLTGSGKLTVNGTLNWSSTGEYRVINTTISSSGIMNITGSSNRSFRYSGGKIYNDGTINWTGSGKIRGASNGFQNNSNGVFNVQINAVMEYDNGGGSALTFLNNGTLNLGTYIFSGSANFTHSANANLTIGSTDGITQSANAGNIQFTSRSYSSSGNYTYNGAAAQVTGDGLPTSVNNLIVNNASGVTLTNDVTVNGNLTLSDGDLSLNGKTITIGASANLSESTGNTVKGTTGKITTTQTFAAGDLSAGVNIAGLGAKITTEASLGTTTIERTHNQASGSYNNGVNRILKISPSDNSGLSATLDFYYDESEIGSIPENDLRLFKSADATDNSWSMIGGAVDADNNKVTLSNIDGFSYWTLGDVNHQLPVELSSFTVQLIDNKVLLNWQTATEINNFGFEVERQYQVSSSEYQEKSWEKVGFVEGHGTTNSPKDYEFTDYELPNSDKVSYRLKQIDLDGKFEYSDVVTVGIENLPAGRQGILSLPTEFALEQNYPNPFNPSTTIVYEIPAFAGMTHVSLKVYDVLGNEVKTPVNENQAPGYYEVKFDASNLSSGVYFYRIQTSSGFFATKKLMILK